MRRKKTGPSTTTRRSRLVVTSEYWQRNAKLLFGKRQGLRILTTEGCLLVARKRTLTLSKGPSA